MEPDELTTFAGQDADTGKYHGLIFRNIPTPSGCIRPILASSTKEGYATPDEALDAVDKIVHDARVGRLIHEAEQCLAGNK